ncbi:STAS domain-containing protein [Micromonospora costi]|uniref:Anti-sigma factor antagonist n=1 Tax=Micromonospora costi TaxID=1530042 RepID=A0A3A9ZY07_9ACTN|nr:STAS domain-containing protein [Micromonospora costi]RKN53040.1 anti-sigma factor antagonist [Micromonospora costi]
MTHAAHHGLLRCDHHDVRPGLRYVTLTGEADLATADQLERDLGRLLAPAWVVHLALDLTLLRYLDCAALAVLVAVRQAASANSQKVTISAAGGTPQRVLALTGVGQLFGYPPPAVVSVPSTRYERMPPSLRQASLRFAS